MEGVGILIQGGKGVRFKEGAVFVVMFNAKGLSGMGVSAVRDRAAGIFRGAGFAGSGGGR